MHLIFLDANTCFVVLVQTNPDLNRTLALNTVNYSCRLLKMKMEFSQSTSLAKRPSKLICYCTIDNYKVLGEAYVRLHNEIKAKDRGLP